MSSILLAAAELGGAPDGGLVERLGVTSILVVFAYYLIKYFIGQLDKKDLRLNDLTDRFVLATREQTEAIRGFIAEQQRSQLTMSTAIDKLTVAVDHLQERRLNQREQSE